MVCPNFLMVWYADIIIFQWICGYVHVYKIIKQLAHACSGNSQNYCPSVLEMTLAEGNSSQVISSTLGQIVLTAFSSHLQHLGSIVLIVP